MSLVGLKRAKVAKSAVGCLLPFLLLTFIIQNTKLVSSKRDIMYLYVFAINNRLLLLVVLAVHSAVDHQTI